MRKRNVLLELQRRRRIPALFLALVLALCLTVFADGFSIVSHAESAGRVNAPGGANVRSSASASANVLTSLVQNDIVSIKSQVQGSDGYTWYEVYVDADTLGYIRSDLVEITDGSTPPASSQTSPSTQQPSDTGAAAPAEAQVSRVNPVSATVVGSGNNGVRIRSDASTNSQIVTTVQSGLVLTVVGQANGLDADAKVWYQVNFTSDNSEVSGFIRSDFVELSEELTPYVEPDTGVEPPEGSETPDSEPEMSKDYETVYQDGAWYLVETAANKGYVIDDMFDMISQSTANKNAYEESEKTVKTQKIWIIILVILLVVAVGAVAFLVFKIKDMMDSAYFNEVEKETLRKRNPQGDRKVMQSVGGDRRGTAQGQRPAVARPSAPGPRPTGTAQGQRLAGGPQSQRPSGSPQSQRPSGTPQGQQRPAGASQSQSADNSGQGQRSSGAPQGQNRQSKQQPKPSGSQGWKSKNFMANEEDEFEFEFLNHDGDDE